MNITYTETTETLYILNYPNNESQMFCTMKINNVYVIKVIIVVVFLSTFIPGAYFLR